jgi:hypothetical protein
MKREDWKDAQMQMMQEASCNERERVEEKEQPARIRTDELRCNV